MERQERLRRGAPRARLKRSMWCARPWGYRKPRSRATLLYSRIHSAGRSTYEGALSACRGGGDTHTTVVLGGTCGCGRAHQKHRDCKGGFSMQSATPARSWGECNLQQVAAAAARCATHPRLQRVQQAQHLLRVVGDVFVGEKVPHRRIHDQQVGPGPAPVRRRGAGVCCRARMHPPQGAALLLAPLP